jgi:DNA-binding transcriptional ArsR family regulator
MTQNYDIVKICDGLAHPIRLKIYEVLLEKKEIKATKLFEIIKDEFEISSRQSLFNHLTVMERAGIIELYKKKKDYYVKLKMLVNVEVEPIEVSV